ncbi:hypothetical protein HGA34_00810 [Candidatus Falkowbacteria bacterium]|nr:hypothetical protein [Candidatus Falkowbacteria bacterium]
MKLKYKIPYKKIIFYAYILIAISGILATAYTVNFLYTNFYQTLTSSVSLLDLKGKVANDSINVKRFDQILGRIKAKKELPEPDRTHDIFD